MIGVAIAGRVCDRYACTVVACNKLSNGRVSRVDEEGDAKCEAWKTTGYIYGSQLPLYRSQGKSSE